MYPGAAVSPDSAAIIQRGKVVYTSNKAVAENLYKNWPWTKVSDASVQTDLPRILDLGILWSETPKVGATPAALKRIQTFAEFKVCGTLFLLLVR